MRAAAIRRSMRARLVAALAAIGFVVFTTAGVLLQWSLARELARQDRADVSGKLDIARHLTTEVLRPEDLPTLFHHLDDMLLGHGDLRIWILGDGDRPIYGGRQAPRLLAEEPGHVAVAREDGVELHGVRARLAAGAGLAGAEIIVAKDTRPRRALLASSGRALVLVCGVGVLAVAGLGAWAMRRGLAPVARLSQAVARIAPETLSTRLPVQGVDEELRALAEGFNLVLDRLEAAYRQMEAFNADVAHELRTPLAVLISGAQVALSAERPASELREVLASGLEELEQMKGLVNDMLFLARADRGEPAPEAAPARLADEARKVADYFEASMAEAGVSLRIEGDGLAVCSASLVRRALANLVSNALKHTAPGETVVIALEEAGDVARIEVSNPGPALPAETLARMFDRFYRADAARAHTGESVGLGLAIVRAIAHMHGGTAWARWRQGRTTVGMSLGRGPAPDGPPRAQAPAHGTPAS